MSKNLLNQFQGCLVGLACGDAWCAPYEGGVAERLLWSLIGKTQQGKKRYTDDTQMSLDIAQLYLKTGQLQQDALAHQFAASYHWSRGYGPATAKLLKSIQRGHVWQNLNRKSFKQGSFGNGAAMRVPVLALIYVQDEQSLARACVSVSELTHCHPFALDSARLIAFLVCGILQDQEPLQALIKASQTLKTTEFQQVIAKLTHQLDSDSLAISQIRKEFGNSISALRSVPSAIYLGLSYIDQPFVNLLKACQDLGGDTDTIAAIAGSIWGAQNGLQSLPIEIASQVESMPEIIKVGHDLYKHSPLAQQH